MWSAQSHFVEIYWFLLNDSVKSSKPDGFLFQYVNKPRRYISTLTQFCCNTNKYIDDDGRFTVPKVISWETCHIAILLSIISMLVNSAALCLIINWSIIYIK